MSDYLADINPDNLANVVRALQREVAALKLRAISGVGTLNEVSDTLEPSTEFEFRSHLDPENPQEPGDGFSGVRIAGQGMDYGGYIYAIAAVLNDILQAGINISQGRIDAGVRTVILDIDGISVLITTDYANLNSYKFLDGTTIVGKLWAYKDITGDAINVELKSEGNANEQGATVTLTAANKDDIRADLVLNSPASGYDTNAGMFGDIATITGWIRINLTSGIIKIGTVDSSLDTDGIIYPNDYTPTLFNTTNVAASTAYVCNYVRIGNIVHFNGSVSVDVTAAGLTYLGISIPIASNFASGLNAAGTAVNVNSESARIYSDSANKRLIMAYYAVTTTNIGWNFHGSYKII